MRPQTLIRLSYNTHHNFGETVPLIHNFWTVHLLPAVNSNGNKNVTLICLLADLFSQKKPQTQKNPATFVNMTPDYHKKPSNINTRSIGNLSIKQV